MSAPHPCRPRCGIGPYPARADPSRDSPAHPLEAAGMGLPIVDTRTPHVFNSFRMKSYLAGWRLAAIAAALGSLVGLVSCADPESGLIVERKRLFTLEYGIGEDQLLPLPGPEDRMPYLPTKIAMRDGIFHISSAAGASVRAFSSFGDVLSMVRDPDSPTRPAFLRELSSVAGSPGGPEDDATSPGRFATSRPLREPGEIAVDSSRFVYVSDRVEPERRATDPSTGAILERIVLKFAPDGRTAIRIGQEGEGGTPFFPIRSIHVSGDDDVAIVSHSEEAWFIHWFDRKATLVRTVRVVRSGLPVPEGMKWLVPGLDAIVPDPVDRAIVFKIDYYRAPVRETIPEREGPPESGGTTDTILSGGGEYAGSRLYRMRLDDATMDPGRDLTMPGPNSHGLRSRSNGDGNIVIPSLFGAAGRLLYFLSVEEDGLTIVTVMNSTGAGKSLRFAIELAPTELRYASFCLSPEGVLCALLKGESGAEFVWWRFDRLLSRPGRQPGESP